MKKLMMFAAAMTIVGGAYASVCAPGSESSPCDTPVWDFVMKGKTANGIEKGYKAVYAISFKGAIVGNLSEVLTPAGDPTMGTKWVATTNVLQTYPVVETPYIPAAGLVVDSLTTNVTVTPTPAVTAGVNGDVLLTTTAKVSGFTHAVTNIVTTNIASIVTNVVAMVPVVVTNFVTYTEIVPGSVAAIAATTVKEEKQLVSITWVEEDIVVTPGTPGESTGECCLDTFTVYVYDKDAKDLIVFEDQEVLKMSVFGKGLVKELKPGQSSSLESDVMWNMVGDEDIALQFVGFGKAKYGLSKGGTSGTVCNPVTEQPCVPSYDWPSWSGWFTGFFGPETADSHDLNCASECVAVAGGTWSAKLNKKLSAASDVEGAIYRKFKVSYIFDEE